MSSMKDVYKYFIQSNKPPYNPSLRIDCTEWKGKIEIYEDQTNGIYIKTHSRVTWYLYDRD